MFEPRFIQCKSFHNSMSQVLLIQCFIFTKCEGNFKQRFSLHAAQLLIVTTPPTLPPANSLTENYQFHTSYLYLTLFLTYFTEIQLISRRRKAKVLSAIVCDRIRKDITSNHMPRQFQLRWLEEKPLKDMIDMENYTRY